MHANLVALDAVLADAGRRSPDAYVCLGDVVGYGPEPNECVARVRALGPAMVAGNHDRGAVGLLPTEAFSPLARAAIEWTAGVLAPDGRAYLSALPERVAMPVFLAVHGSPRDPIQEYILDLPTALAVFAESTFGLCFVGHTHLPGIFLRDADGRIGSRDLRPDEPVPLDGRSRYIVNAGSVGQPRDGDPRAAYLTLDEAGGGPAVTLHRVRYDIAATQAKMRAQGLPALLARRLASGS